MEQKIPIRIGSDSFMYMDAKYGVTKELLKILKFYGYPYIIFTRSDLIAHEDYLELLSKDLCSVQFSISGNNQDFIRNIEPGAPSYRRRLKALEKLAKHGFWTTVRINPLFPRYPDGYFTDPDYIRGKFGSRESVPTLPFYDNQFIAELADARVPSVLAGVVRLSPWAINSMSRATGVDIRSFFRPEVTTSKGDKHFSDAENRHYHQWISNECRKHGLRFSTCYIRNGIKDYIQYQSIWSNKIRDCCDAIGNVTAFSKTSQQTPWDSGAKHTWRKEDALKQEAVDQHVQVE
jgi:DNA repair photolyase